MFQTIVGQFSPLRNISRSKGENFGNFTENVDGPTAFINLHAQVNVTNWLNGPTLGNNTLSSL